MPLILNGSTGISGTDGSASVPAVQGTDTNTGMFFPAADQIAFAEGGVEAMRLDAAGNVGIGTSSPSQRLTVNGTARVDGNVESAASPYVYSWQGGTAGQVRSGFLLDGSGQTLQFFTGSNERARITTTGALQVGTTAGVVIGGELLSVQGSMGVKSSEITTSGLWNTNSSGNYLLFYIGGGTLTGSIVTGGSTTSYNTSSDYRLKENVTPLTDAAARVQALKPSRFNFIADSSRTVDGFIAHEAAEVVPEAVHGEKDGVDAEGRIQPQGIDHSKLVPLLTAALQEALTEIASLKARVAVLEAR